MTDKALVCWNEKKYIYKLVLDTLSGSFLDFVSFIHSAVMVKIMAYQISNFKVQIVYARDSIKRVYAHSFG